MIDFDKDRRFRAFIFCQRAGVPKWALLKIIRALPTDALLFHADFSGIRNSYCLTFWSKEFDICPLGQEVPCFSAWIDTEKRHAGIL